MSNETILKVNSSNLVTIRTRLKEAAEKDLPITLSGIAACALYYAMDTGRPMEPEKPRVPDGVYDNNAKMRREEWKNGELVRWVDYRVIAAAPPGHFAAWQSAPDLPKGTET